MSSGTRTLPLIVASALFLEQMDSTIIATSLPAMAADLGTSPVALKLAFTTYLLGLTVVLPVSGWVADHFGAKHVFRLSIIVFMAGSIACGFADSLGWLVAARGLQGVGGALMVPIARIIVLRSAKKSELIDAMAWLTIPALLGPVIGPPLGGFITTTYDWRWIFWINVPIGLLALALVTWVMPALPSEKLPPLDVKGFLLSGTGLTLVVLGATLAGRGLLPVWAICAMIVTGLLSLVVYVRHAHAAAHPLLDLRIFRDNVFRQTVIGGSLFRIVVGATPFLLPLMLQLGFGYSAFESGLVTFASTLGALLMKFTVAPIVRHFGFRDLLIVNGVLGCASIAAKAFFEADTPYLVMFSVLIIGGFLRSLQFSSLNTLAYANIESADIARANALYTVCQQLSLAIGVASAAFLLDASMWWQGRAALVAGDFSFAFLVTAAVSCVGVVSYMRLPIEAGANISGRVAVTPSKE